MTGSGLITPKSARAARTSNGRLAQQLFCQAKLPGKFAYRNAPKGTCRLRRLASMSRHESPGFASRLTATFCRFGQIGSNCQPFELSALGGQVIINVF